MKRRGVVSPSRPAFNKSAIRRLARRAGVKRMSGEVYEEAPIVLRTWLTNIMKDTCCLTEHARRKTVIVTDVLMALKRNGM